MADMIHLRLEKKIREEIKKAVKNNLFSNESEFIRDSIRKNIETYRKIKTLETLKSSMKNGKGIGKPSDVFGEFGIE